MKNPISYASKICSGTFSEISWRSCPYWIVDMASSKNTPRKSTRGVNTPQRFHVVSLSPEKMVMRIQSLNTYFRNSNNPKEVLGLLSTKPKMKIQDGGHYDGSTYISVCRLERKAISMAKPMFSVSSNPTENNFPTKKMENPRWRPLNWKYLHLSLLDLRT